MAFLLLFRRRRRLFCRYHFYMICDTLADRDPHRPMQQAVYQLSIHPVREQGKRKKINEI